MARRMKARFPQGELLLDELEEESADADEWRGATA